MFYIGRGTSTFDDQTEKWSFKLVFFFNFQGGDYSKRLSQELKSSLYQRDLQNQMWNGDVPPQNMHVSIKEGK